MRLQIIKKEVSNLNKREQEELLQFIFELLGNDDFYLSNDLKKEIDKREEALKNKTSIGRPAREVIIKK